MSDNNMTLPPWIIELWRLGKIDSYFIGITCVLATCSAFLILVVLMSSWELRTRFKIQFLVSSLIVIMLSAGIGDPMWVIVHDRNIRLDFSEWCKMYEIMTRIEEVEDLITGVNLLYLVANLVLTEKKNNFSHHVPSM